MKGKEASANNNAGQEDCNEWLHWWEIYEDIEASGNTIAGVLGCELWRSSEFQET